MVDMIALQKELQETSFGYDFSKMSDESKIDFIQWNYIALVDELHEALDEIGWKPWATSRHINTEAVKGELIDAFHFFMNLCIVVGIDTADLERRYLLKRTKNEKRQKDGYDGVSTKCPVCKRALDDDAVSCAVNGKNVFCDTLQDNRNMNEV